MPSLLLIKIELILACIQHKDHQDAIVKKIIGICTDGSEREIGTFWISSEPLEDSYGLLHFREVHGWEGISSWSFLKNDQIKGRVFEFEGFWMKVTGAKKDEVQVLVFEKCFMGSILKPCNQRLKVSDVLNRIAPK